MLRMFKPVRIVLILLTMAALLTIYVTALYRIQIFDARPEEDDQRPATIVRRRETVAAARGNIYDRNGVLLASNRPSYNIMLNRPTLLTFTNDERNEIILELVYTAIAEGVRYNDTFPITQGAPFTYISNMTGEQRRRLDRFLERYSIDPNISESDLLAWMRTHYRIDYTIGITDARLIIGVRYELEMRTIITNLPPYVFATDVRTDFVSLIEERNLIAVHVEKVSIREYHTTYAAHILGYIRPMTPEQYERYSQFDPPYPMNALVGQAGVEAALEDVLRGVSGSQTISVSATGIVVDLVTLSEPIPGNHVYLTIDIGFQAAVENALRVHIESVNMELEDESLMITGGAVVVTDVRTGEVLAAASNPTYDPTTLSRDYPMLSTDPTLPMLNRATQGRYQPGSTFKMVTALAALRNETVSRYSPIDCVGRFERYAHLSPPFRPACWIHSQGGVGHGPLDIVQSIAQSCNYFYFQVSDWMLGGGRDSAWAIAEAAKDFGLGISTGIQVPENLGILSTPDYATEVLGREGWYSGDTIMVAFGQGDNLFTPLQLASYSSTIANGGTLYELSILRRIRNADMTELLFSHQPKVISEIREKQYIAYLQEGMREATRRASRGTAASVFNDYPIRVAAKTGTVQIEGSEINNAVFVCYAPANDPEIAISIVVERGVAGSAIMNIARGVFDYYFRTETTVIAAPFGELIP